jgi:hypothetical protein
MRQNTPAPMIRTCVSDIFDLRACSLMQCRNINTQVLLAGSCSRSKLWSHFTLSRCFDQGPLLFARHRRPPKQLIKRTLPSWRTMDSGIPPGHVQQSRILLFKVDAENGRETLTEGRDHITSATTAPSVGAHADLLRVCYPLQIGEQQTTSR